MAGAPMLEYRVKAHRVDGHGGIAEAKEASIALDTDLARLVGVIRRATV
jgi:hypothetical protein